MSAAEDDTELRDLLLQNLENSGVLNKLKAQMRAAVFLAMEEQDRIENKTPLLNESLKKCLNTKDGRVTAGLVMDFLQVFDLDFTLSVFEPETNAKPLESRELLCKDLGLDPNPKSPVLLELVQRRHKDRTRDQTRDQRGVQTGVQSRDLTRNQDPTEKQLQWVRKHFDIYDQDGRGSVNREDVKRVFFDLFPQMNKKVLEVTVEELRDSDRGGFNRSCDWSSFLRLYQRIFSQSFCVVNSGADSAEAEERLPSLNQDSEAKGDSTLKKPGLNQDLDPERGPKPGLNQDRDLERGPKPGLNQDRDLERGPKPGLNPDRDLEKNLDLDDVDEGDSFFDDPFPAPQKTYGCSEDSGPALVLRRDKSLSDLSVLGTPVEEPELRKPESPVPSLSLGRSSSSEPKTGVSKDKAAKESRPHSDRSGSQRQDEDVDYDDDFNSHRSDLSRSELSIGEEIEEGSINGPEPSEQDETTQDLSVSQLSHSAADYMEDVP